MFAKTFAVLALGLWATLAAAETPETIMWDDLVPPGDPIENPFLNLDEDTRFDLGTIAVWRADMELGFIEVGSDDHKTLLKMEADFAASGIDVDAMMAAAQKLDEEIARRGHDTVAALDGQTIRMPGYALPLEAVEGGIREFLLVPYIGACIHVPPPPPNQIVFVETSEEFIAESLYDPVWITGKIEIQAGSRSLTFVDGTNDIPTGYTIKAVNIEPYEFD